VPEYGWLADRTLVWTVGSPPRWLMPQTRSRAGQCLCGCEQLCSHAAQPSTVRRKMPARGIQHLDLAVGDVKRSLAFYYAMLGGLGLAER
jgi:hypothetical protein